MKKSLQFMAGIFALLCLCGCQAISFYSQAAAGEYQVLAHEKSVASLIANPKTPLRLKQRLQAVQQIRAFAASALHLPAEHAYTKYTDLHRSSVVWNVNVCPPLSLQSKTWWFPIVGLASYRGYFKENAARHYAARWQKHGWDVYVSAVDAYSTLGWFRDPLLNTFIFEPEEDLAETIFHELAHRRLFVAGDTDFNEAYATAVAAEGLRRWLGASTNTNAYTAHQADQKRDRQFVDLVLQTRQELSAVYANPNLTEPEEFHRKEEIIAQLRARWQALPKSGADESGYDYWLARPINNAQLNTVSAYYDLTPAFAALLREKKGDFEEFFRAVAALAKLSKTERRLSLAKSLAAFPAALKTD